jgi:hypothetical protein
MSVYRLRRTREPDVAARLLIDHQSGLFQVVKDIPLPELQRNAIALARLATLTKLPVITPASVPSVRTAH